jgi:hypothetical protein
MVAALQHWRRLAANIESNDCGKLRIVYFLVVRGAHGSSDQRGLRSGADVQIGGGVRVGDAFQAIVGSNLIAI